MAHKGKRLAVMPESSEADELGSEPTLDRAIQARIGDHLRAMYDELLQQPVPDRFKQLLGQLDTDNDRKGRGR
jgi:Anti-sigma factor NepR